MNRRTHLSLHAARLMPHIHPHLQQWFPQALWKGNPAHAEIALSFDDGPDRIDTPQLLEVLARHQVVATFFVLGERAAAFPHLVQAIHAAGHHIGLHGYTHTHFPLIEANQLRLQLAATRDTISAASGCDPSRLRDVRPPYGTFLPETLTYLLRWNYRPVMWSSVPLHWLQPTSVTVQQVQRQATNGTLLVLHEAQPTGPAVAPLVEQLIPLLKAANLTFVTVDQMWQAHQRTAHRTAGGRHG